MEQMFRDAIELETLRQMAITLLGSEKKELKNMTKFHIPLGGLPVIPGGVYPFSPGRYALLTPDGLAEIREGDWILQTTDNQFYYLRLETTE